MISVAKSFSGKPRQASMAAYRQLLAENHVEEILADVKQNKNLDRKKGEAEQKFGSQEGTACMAASCGVF